MANDFDIRLTYHPPKTDQIPKYRELRQCTRSLALLIEGSCPDSQERSLAITRLEEALMWANAAIARRS